MSKPSMHMLVHSRSFSPPFAGSGSVGIAPDRSRLFRLFSLVLVCSRSISIVLAGKFHLPLSKAYPGTRRPLYGKSSFESSEGKLAGIDRCPRSSFHECQRARMTCFVTAKHKSEHIHTFAGVFSLHIYIPSVSLKVLTIFLYWPLHCFKKKSYNGGNPTPRSAQLFLKRSHAII